MADELHKQNGHVDVLSLARELGTPVALVSATTGEGLVAVQNFLTSATSEPRTAGTACGREHTRIPGMGGSSR